MSLRIEPAEGEPIEIARRAIGHALRRIRDDANVGYHMGLGTETFSRLVQAASALSGEPIEKVQADFAPRGREQDRELPRNEVEEIRYELEDEMAARIARSRQRNESHPEWSPDVSALADVANRLRAVLGMKRADFIEGEWIEVESEAAS